MLVTLQRSQSTQPVSAGVLPLWPLRIDATVSDGDMDNAIFVYLAATRNGQNADRFSAVASVQQMMELTNTRAQRGDSSYYRSSSAYYALRNPGDVADVISAINDDVAQLVRGWAAKVMISTSGTDVIGYDPGYTPPTTVPNTPTVALSVRFPNVISLTGLVGGGPNNLDGQTTAGVPLNCMVDFYLSVAGQLIPQRWVLTVWTSETTDAVAGRVLPVDFNSATNPKLWQRLL